MKRLLVGLILTLVVLLYGGASPAKADSAPPDPQQQLALISQIRAQLGSNLADALAAEQQLRQSLQDNSMQQSTVQIQIADVQQKIIDLETRIASAKSREAILAGRIQTERAQLGQLARAIYMAPTSPLLVLAEAHSLSDLLTRIADLNVAGSRASDLKAAISSDLTALQAEREQEQEARDQELTQRDTLAAELAQLQVLQAQQEKSMAALEAKIAETRTELYLITRQSAKLAQQVADMLQQQEDAVISAAMQSVWTQVQLWSQSNSLGQISTSPGHSTKYRFIWPEPNGQISQPFGPTTLALEPAYAGYLHFHTGIDLVEAFGSPVYAADDGIVALVGSSGSGYGNYVVIAHSGGLDTLYGHLATALVKPGHVVIQGQPIGLEGSTGNSTGPHVHFELRIGGKPVNPAPYLPPGQPSGFKA